LDCWLSIVNNGNFNENGSSLTRHHLQKWMKDFVEKMTIHNALLNNKSTSEVFLVPFWYVNVESKVGEPITLAML
jgi:hypothetical protein